MVPHLAKQCIYVAPDVKAIAVQAMADYAHADALRAAQTAQTHLVSSVPPPVLPTMSSLASATAECYYPVTQLVRII